MPCFDEAVDGIYWNMATGLLEPDQWFVGAGGAATDVFKDMPIKSCLDPLAEIPAVPHNLDSMTANDYHSKDSEMRGQSSGWGYAGRWPDIGGGYLNLPDPAIHAHAGVIQCPWDDYTVDGYHTPLHVCSPTAGPSPCANDQWDLSQYPPRSPTVAALSPPRYEASSDALQTEDDILRSSFDRTCTTAADHTLLHCLRPSALERRDFISATAGYSPAELSSVSSAFCTSSYASCGSSHACYEGSPPSPSSSACNSDEESWDNGTRIAASDCSAAKLASSERRKRVPRFECRMPDCGSTFTTRVNYESHMDAHCGDRRHRCPSCGDKFRRLSDMKRHARKHSAAGVTKSACDACYKTFTRKDTLKAHRKKAHSL